MNCIEQMNRCWCLVYDELMNHNNHSMADLRSGLRGKVRLCTCPRVLLELTACKLHVNMVTVNTRRPQQAAGWNSNTLCCLC